MSVPLPCLYILSFVLHYTYVECSNFVIFVIFTLTFQTLVEHLIDAVDYSSAHNYALLLLWASQANAVPVSHTICPNSQIITFEVSRLTFYAVTGYHALGS